MHVKSRKEEQAEATRRALIDNARLLFAERGFSAVTLDQVAQTTRVTKGAVYHHFKGKKELFHAAAQEAHQELAQVVESASEEHEEPFAALQVAAIAYLDACVRPEIGRIAVLDAPSILGWKDWCKLQQEHGVAAFSHLLGRVLGADVAARSLDSSAQMIMGAIDVGARAIAQSNNPEAIREDVVGTIDRMLRGVVG
jgi:AcrR family transcriptional regulator